MAGRRYNFMKANDVGLPSSTHSLPLLVKWKEHGLTQNKTTGLLDRTPVWDSRNLEFHSCLQNNQLTYFTFHLVFSAVKWGQSYSAPMEVLYNEEGPISAQIDTILRRG